LKKLNLLILKSFIGPFLATFCISMFLFLMHFLWKYIDEMVGKGLETHLVAKLLFFSLPDLIPYALPLAVLLSSLMTYGNLAETSELVAIKASGVSLRKALMPSFGVMIILSILTFYVTNIVIPLANLEFKSMLYDVRSKKPAFNLKEGIFYNEIENFSIKVSKKEPDNQTIRNIIIYEKKPGQNQLGIIRAEWGTMKVSKDERLLLFTLYNGVRYEEMVNAKNYHQTYPHNTMKFSKQEMAFDLSQLDMKKTDKNTFAGNYRLMNVVEIFESLDSLDRTIKQVRQYHYDYSRPYIGLYSQNYKDKDSVSMINTDTTLISNYNSDQRLSIMNNALSSVRNMKSMVEVNTRTEKHHASERKNHYLEIYKKFTLSSVILVLFLLAAPLGTIIRKGGLGMPMVISILMFILYYVLDMIGVKMAKEDKLPIWFGAWFSTIMLMPLAIWVLVKASKDAPLFEKGRLINKLTKLFKPKKSIA
jgi:lipopolysaccharide export system permease protein